jgi:hypothetical protein
MEEKKQETVEIIEEKGFFGKVKDFAVKHKSKLIKGAVGAGLLIAGYQAGKRNAFTDFEEVNDYDKLESGLNDSPFYEDDTEEVESEVKSEEK